MINGVSDRARSTALSPPPRDDIVWSRRESLHYIVGCYSYYDRVGDYFF